MASMSGSGEVLLEVGCRVLSSCYILTEQRADGGGVLSNSVKALVPLMRAALSWSHIILVIPERFYLLLALHYVVGFQDLNLGRVTSSQSITHYIIWLAIHHWAIWEHTKPLFPKKKSSLRNKRHKMHTSLQDPHRISPGHPLIVCVCAQ